MGDRVSKVGQKLGAAVPLGPHLTQCRVGQGLPFYQDASNRLVTMYQRYGQDRWDNGPVA